MQSLQGAALEDRVAYLNGLVKGAPASLTEDFQARFDMSWIYHDSVLEGVVYTQGELLGALRSDAAQEDNSLTPIYDEIRNHRAALGIIRELAERKRFQLNVETIKKLYAQLAPEELEGKTPPKYRKDIPVHRLYFHEIAAPDKISYRMRQLVEWMSDPETKRGMHPVRMAAKAHYQLMHIYPFPRHSGKVARLVMNLILLRSGFPPVVIHATERQRYYDALKTGDNATAILIQEALAASIESTIRFYEEATGAASSSAS